MAYLCVQKYTRMYIVEQYHLLLWSNYNLPYTWLDDFTFTVCNYHNGNNVLHPHFHVRKFRLSKAK